MYASIEELVSDATIKNLPISELVIQAECNDMNVSRNDVWRKMKHNLDTMRLAVSRGAHGIGVHSKTGLTGGDAVNVQLQQQDLQVLFQEYYLLLKRGWD